MLPSVTFRVRKANRKRPSTHVAARIGRQSHSTTWRLIKVAASVVVSCRRIVVRLSGAAAGRGAAPSAQVAEDQRQQETALSHSAARRWPICLRRPVGDLAPRWRAGRVVHDPDDRAQRTDSAGTRPHACDRGARAIFRLAGRRPIRHLGGLRLPRSLSRRRDGSRPRQHARQQPAEQRCGVFDAIGLELTREDLLRTVWPCRPRGRIMFVFRRKGTVLDAEAHAIR
jgi:hypothetical protein